VDILNLFLNDLIDVPVRGDLESLLLAFCARDMELQRRQLVQAFLEPIRAPQQQQLEDGEEEAEERRKK